jgi:long-chain acyl-CoA synthetase
VREISVPSTGAVKPDENLTDLVFDNAERYPDAVSFRRRTEGGWVGVPAKTFAREVEDLAKGLIAAGMQPGDRVGLMSRTRYEWTLLDFALWTAGTVPVPIYETSSADQVEWILSDSRAAAVVVETAEHEAVVRSALAGLSDMRHVWRIDAGPEGSGVVAKLTALGTEIGDEQVAERMRSRAASDLATLVYTSGTTGRPKGCELSHQNLLAEVRSAAAAFPELMEPGNSLLVFLPLAHVLARALTLSCLHSRITMGHTPDVKNLLADLAEFRPTFVVAVPRVFEKVYNSAKQQARLSGKGRAFDAAEATAVAYSRALDAGRVPVGLRARRAVFDKLVYVKLRTALGGRVVAALSGGAPLGERLAHFFRGIDIPVLEGYGLTETSAAAAINTRESFRIGTVGKPVTGTAVRIAPDGEVLISGDVVFNGYWNNARASAEALEDGWFHTGDLGELDGDGYLRITGRKKEMLVTAAGKNVPPAPLEDRLRAHPLVSQCMVVGDRQPFIAVLITLDEEFLPGWKSEHGKPEDAGLARLATDGDLRAELQAAVDDANEAVSTAESIRAFTVLPRDFTEADGEITPSLKVRRGVVAEHYAAEIAAIYGG